ncbi:LysR family transcriptional regulator substrate-binding protein [Chondromyces crocatus]|uniref:LysR family transcriptional regulator substrate-binding protein n=1 Tax=Chondromyces crocatus TaxID=52 RepID=UPI003CCBB8D1
MHLPRRAARAPLVCLTRGAGIRTAFDDACASRGLRPHVPFGASAPDTVAALAIRGLGVALLAESMARQHRAELHALRITDPEPRAQFGLFWRAGQTTNPAAHALLGYARDTFTRPR